MKILPAEYFGHKSTHDDATPERVDNAFALLDKVNALLAEYEAAGNRLQKDPDTGTLISGSKDGAGDGGFRLSESSTGRPGSAHKEGMAVDVFDPIGKLDDWIDRNMLLKHGLYREVKTSTIGWCHLQTRKPKSGNRSFLP